MSTNATSDYPGERLGLPEIGAGAVAGWGRRILALLIDWAIALLIVGAFVGNEVWAATGWLRWAPLVVFFVQISLMTILTGSSIGQRVLGVDVRRVRGGVLPPGAVLLRSLLLCLAIPAMVFDRDQRGLHDLAAGSITLRRR